MRGIGNGAKHIVHLLFDSLHFFFQDGRFFLERSCFRFDGFRLLTLSFAHERPDFSAQGIALSQQIVQLGLCASSFSIPFKDLVEVLTRIDVTLVQGSCNLLFFFPQ